MLLLSLTLYCINSVFRSLLRNNQRQIPIVDILIITALIENFSMIPSYFDIKSCPNLIIWVLNKFAKFKKEVARRQPSTLYNAKDKNKNNIHFHSKFSNNSIILIKFLNNFFILMLMQRYYFILVIVIIQGECWNLEKYINRADQALDEWDIDIGRMGKDSVA